MAKRRHDGETELPFVALMDTMTNVVGVLIIVLVMIGISLAAAVHKVLSDLPPASPQQVGVVQAALDKVIAALKSSKGKEASLDLPKPTAAQIDKEILQIETSLKDKNIKLFDFASLRKELEKRKDELAREKVNFAAIAAERDKLKALLDETPAPPQPKATVVRIPVSREIPPTADIMYCFVKKDQVFLVTPSLVEGQIMRDFNAVRRDLVKEVIRKKGQPDRIIYDQGKVTDLFAKKDYSVRGQKVSVPPAPTSNRLSLIIQTGAQADANDADLDQPDGRFRGMMTTLRQMPRAVLVFKVSPDGFGTYLKARAVADACNVPCGWEIDGNNTIRSRLSFEVKPLLVPPPQPPPPPNQPKPPPPRPQPKLTLD